MLDTDVRVAAPPVEGRADTRDVTLVVTAGFGSLDLYSQRLSAHLPVATLESSIYENLSSRFGNAVLSRRAYAGLRADVSFTRLLRAVGGPVHLPNHHLGRYAIGMREPYVVTVHDLIRYFDVRRSNRFIERPTVGDRLGLRLDLRGIRRAPSIISVSETTKRDLVEHLGIPERRITVVYEGVDHALFRPVVGRPLDEPYVLFVGSEQPRKNLRGLMAAFAALKREPAFRDVRLVKIGRPGGTDASFRAATIAAVREHGLEGDVIFTGYVPDDDLPSWYSAAECLVLPSFYEGFGFPPVEAMACGCPVVVSTAGALPEIAGDAALLVEPSDLRALAGAIRDVVLDPSLRRELVARGRRRAARFSWERAAQETLAVYERM